MELMVSFEAVNIVGTWQAATTYHRDYTVTQQHTITQHSGHTSVLRVGIPRQNPSMGSDGIALPLKTNEFFFSFASLRV